MTRKTMWTASAIVAAVAIVGLVSCHHFMPQDVPPPVHILDVPPTPVTGQQWTHQCNVNPGQACQIDIDVSAGKCEPAQTGVKIAQDRLIHWKLKGGGGNWKFATNGIDFVTPPPGKPNKPNPNAGNAFDQLGGGGTAQFQAHVTSNAAAGGYAYTVTLVGPGGQTCSFDPAIWV